MFLSINVLKSAHLLKHKTLIFFSLVILSSESISLTEKTWCSIDWHQYWSLNSGMSFYLLTAVTEISLLAPAGRPVVSSVVLPPWLPCVLAAGLSCFVWKLGKSKLGKNGCMNGCKWHFQQLHLRTTGFSPLCGTWQPSPLSPVCNHTSTINVTKIVQEKIVTIFYLLALFFFFF